MVFAIAALLFQLTPAVHALPDVALTSTADVAKTTPPPALQPLKLPSDGTIAAAGVPSNGAGSEALTTAALGLTPQNSQSFSTIRLPEPQPEKPVHFVAAETLPGRRVWMMLSIAEHSAAAFDAYSTRRAIASGAVEEDPMMRPFANSPAIYAAIQAGPVLLDFVARRMQRSQNSLLRRAWWVPQSASAGMFLFSGVHNIRVANQQ